MASLSEAAEKFANGIQKAVYAAVAETAGRVIARAQAEADWSKRIPKAIKLEDIKVDRNSVVATIVVDAEEAPHAVAFELGSGLHRTRGEKEKYPIRPKKAKALKFPFTITYHPSQQKLIGTKGIGGYWATMRELEKAGSVSGEMFWRYVEHPGVEPRPFLKPAAEEGMEYLVQRLRERFKSEFHVAFNIEVRTS